MRTITMLAVFALTACDEFQASDPPAIEDRDDSDAPARTYVHDNGRAPSPNPPPERRPSRR